jgi:hypothetical protein
VQCVQHELERCQPLLSVDDGPRLHAANRILRLLEDHCAEEVRLEPYVRLLQ